MFIRYCILLVATSLAVLGCDSRSVLQQRKDQIVQKNEALDRKCSAIAMKAIRERWIIDGGTWYGRLPDGSILRLESPEPKVESVHEGRPFYSGWAGTISLTAARWKTSRPVTHTGPFVISYRAFLKDLKNCALEQIEGDDITQPSPAELTAIVWPD